MTFDPWQYYAISDSECLTRYDVTPRLGPPTYKKDTEVICTSYYSRLNPLEHGEVRQASLARPLALPLLFLIPFFLPQIHTSLINGRPGADDLTSELLNFTSARYIRLRLQRIRTLNADLMTLSTRDPRDIDPIVTRRVRRWSPVQFQRCGSPDSGGRQTGSCCSSGWLFTCAGAGEQR